MDEGAVLSDLLDSNSPYAADTKPGTTIVFAPGVYELDVPLTIGQDVALVGAGREKTVFRAGTEPAVLFQVAGGDVDFTLSGIYIQGVEDNSHNNSSALQIGTNGSPNTGKIVIEDCRFSDFTKNSITVKGGDAAITGNLIDCKLYPGATGNGIQIDMGARAVILRTPVSGFLYRKDLSAQAVPLVLVVLGSGVFSMLQIYYTFASMRRQNCISCIYYFSGHTINLHCLWMYLVGRFDRRGAVLCCGPYDYFCVVLGIIVKEKLRGERAYAGDHSGHHHAQFGAVHCPLPGGAAGTDLPGL